MLFHSLVSSDLPSPLGVKAHSTRSVASPARDVSPIVWTDYTYDSEHGIAEGVPLAFSDAASHSLGEPWLHT